MQETITIRRATAEDAATISRQRRLMFTDMGQGESETLASMERAFLPWVIEAMAAGRYLGWLAAVQVDDQERVVAGAGLMLIPWLPRFDDFSSLRGYVLNVYTDPDYRRRGLANRLVTAALDWCREQGIRTVTLHASDQGRPVYEAMGFEATNEMRINLSEESKA